MSSEKKPHPVLGYRDASSASQVTADKTPCHEESEKSMKCLSDNAFDKAKCQVYFENYK